MSEPGAWFLVLSGLSFMPFLVVSVTPFLRFVIVFSAIRYALGLQQTPPNIVIISLSLFLAFFVMGDMPAVFFDDVLKPFVAGSVPLDTARKSLSARTTSASDSLSPRSCCPNSRSRLKPHFS
jgi:flagellar biosynthetic protein FliP